jgi:hypothetical protein
MSAVNVTIVGNLSKMGAGSSTDVEGPVMIIGQATLTGLEVGGGPVTPPPMVGGGPIWPGAHPSHPIAPGGGPFPSHPIAPGGISPEHPIVLPPDLPPTLPPPDGRPVDWKAAWTPTTGWIIVGIPTGPVPTPSKEDAAKTGGVAGKR